MMTANHIIERLQQIVGHKNVLIDEDQTRLYRQGKRYGSGDVLAVVKPATLLEQWKVLKAVLPDCIIIMQAANTGLTGGSTPFGSNYDRPIIILNTTRIKGIQLINEAKQVVCLPGATLNELEKILAPHNREPHSVIGSSCIGASILGGICNNSGGALVRRGPAYTELALYARLNENNELELVNHLGINLGKTPEEILSRLETGQYTVADIDNSGERKASDARYAHDVAQVDADTPARFNNDPSRLFEASGSAGKVSIFAVRLDTFEKVASEVFYIGSNTQADLTAVRRYLLKELPRLPIAGEYIHRTAYDIGAEYGKDIFLFIEKLGTDKVPSAFAFKAKVDGLLEKFRCKGLTDKLIQFFTRLLPNHLPKRMNEYRDKYQHHLIIRIEKQDVPQVQAFLTDYFTTHTTGDFFFCSPDEGRKAFLHRFAIAGAAIRYRDCHQKTVEDIVALDIALRRNDQEWEEELPEELNKDIIHKLYYGHFFCHVFHQDYIVRKGVDPLAMEHKMWHILDGRGAEYPAEHNVGHLYLAKAALVNHYRRLDPTNTFNVGIGHTTRNRFWVE